MKTTGEKIRSIRKQRGLTQNQFADKLGVTRSLVTQWETGKRQCQPYDVEHIAATFGIDEGLIAGEVSIPNQTVAADLGLSNLSIEQLKFFNGFYKTYHEHKALVEIDSGVDGIVETEGYNPSECLKMVDMLISQPMGNYLLTLLYRYIYADFSQAYTDDENTIDSLVFNASGGKTRIEPSLMKFAVFRAIEQVTDDLRDIMSEEEV